MADRFWVGGSGAWDETNTANWSTTPGGAGGASVPTSADDAYFGVWSGTGVVSIGGNSVVVNCGALYCELGYAGTFTSVGYGLYIHKGLRLAAGMAVSNFLALFYPDRGGIYAIDLAGCTIGRLQTFSSGGTSSYIAASDIRAVADVTLGRSFDLAGFNLYARYISSSTSATRVINLGTGVVTLTGAYTSPFEITSTGLTLVSDQTHVVLDNIGGSTKSFLAPSGATFSSVTLTGQPQIVSFKAGAYTFKTLVSSARNTIKLPAGFTTTVQNFAVTGSAAGMATLTSTSTTRANIVYAGGGVVSTDYLRVSYINATPSAGTWYVGKNSWDEGYNTGFIFDYPPSSNGGLLFGSNF